MKSKVILITGASSGMGFASLKKLAASGHIVYGTCRKPEDAQKIREMGGHPLIVEMTDYTAIEKAVKTVINEQNHIDVLFNNAGFGLYGTVEETSIDEAKRQFDVNLFSLAKITQVVLPYMREQNAGLIINTSSMGGKIYTPLGAWYHATKHALEGWSDCLRLEVKSFGIHVVIIEPGAISTPWGLKAVDSLDKNSANGPYKNFVRKTISSLRNNYTNPKSMSGPEVVADVVAEVINTNNPKTRYVAGKYAKLLITLRLIFGDRIFDKIITTVI